MFLGLLGVFTPWERGGIGGGGRHASLKCKNLSREGPSCLGLKEGLPPMIVEIKVLFTPQLVSSYPFFTLNKMFIDAIELKPALIKSLFKMQLNLVLIFLRIIWGHLGQNIQ